MKHLLQKTGETLCSVYCVSMITEVPVSVLLERFPLRNGRWNSDQTFNVLGFYNWMLVDPDAKKVGLLGSQTHVMVWDGPNSKILDPNGQTQPSLVNYELFSLEKLC